MNAPPWQAHLADRLAAELPDLQGQRPRLRLLGPPRQHTYSRQHWFEASVAGQVWARIIVKQAFGERAAAPAAEFAALQTLHAHFAAQPDLRTARPLLLLADPPAVVMAALPGRPLFRVMQACRRPHGHGRGLAAACHALHTTGRWLAHLHRLPPPATARPAPAPAARLAGIWQQLAAQNTEIADLTAIKNHFERVLAGRTWGDPVLLHGDLTLRNVLVQADGGVAVLDTDLALTGPAAYDLGFLDASLDFIDRWQVLSRGRLYDDAGLGLARMALRDGYDAGGAADDVALCRALRLLQRAAELGEHVQRTRPALARVLIPRLIHPYFLAAAARALGVG